MTLKHITWRPTGVPRVALITIAALALVGMLAVDILQTKRVQPYYPEKMAAARLAEQAMKVLKEERIRRRIPIDRDTDPTESGMIGDLVSPVTSNTGTLSAKQTSVNPNFAAVVVQLLRQAGVEEGDTVAVSLSGSFPAINVCVCAALEALKLRPVLISSASASSWGANNSRFLWLDMERTLYDRKLMGFRSVASSVGGVEDRGMGMPDEGIQRIRNAVQRNGLPFIDPLDFNDSIQQRMALYRANAGDAAIRAYINVGGGTTSVGTKIGKQLFRPGLNRRLPTGGPPVDSVMTRMIEEGVPVIHLVQVEKLAKRYGLPIQPARPPIVGEGEVFYSQEYNPLLATGVLLAILGAVALFVRSDWGFRILFARRRGRPSKHPEPMV